MCELILCTALLLGFAACDPNSKSCIIIFKLLLIEYGQNEL